MEGLLGSYRELYELAPAGYFNLDPFGTIRAVNQTGAGFLGVEQGLLINRRLDDFISAETRSHYRDFLEKVFAGDAKEVCEVDLVKQDQAPLFVQIEAVVAASGEYCRAVVIDITKRKSAEVSLRKSEELNRKTLQALPAHIAVIDRTGVIISVNNAWMTFACENDLNGEAGVAVGVNYLDICRRSARESDVDAAAALAGIEAILSGEQNQFTLEYPCHSPDQQRWFLMKVVPYGSGDGAVISHLDITDRKRAERALIHAKEEWERTFDSVPDLIAILDSQHRINRVNQAMANQLNVEQAECIGLPCYKAIHGTNVPPSFCPHNRSLTDLEKHESLVEETVFGGSFLISTTPLLNSDGDMYASVHVARDVTRLTQAEKKLRENEERLRFYLENSPMAVVEWDRDLTFIQWTGESEMMFGWSSAEVVGKPIAELNMIYADDMQLVESVMAQLTAGEIRRVVATNRNVTKNGEVRYCTWYSTGLMGKDGRMSSVLSMVIDITERITLENELLNARNELEHRVRERTEELEETIQNLQAETQRRLQAVEALRRQELAMIQQNRHAAMGEMIGNIAHQWRQPLNTLGLFTQRLGFFYDSPEFNKEFVDTSVAKSMEIIEYMSRTIDDFRSFFSTDREKVEFKIDEMVSRALSLVETGFNEHKICVERGESENVTIYGFPNEYAQVLLNILINAKDVIIERNIASPRVLIHSRNENGMAVVTIADNAGGIPEDVMSKIFDPYFTTKGPQQGTGIGLFLAKTIIETSMGGKLSVHNTDEGAEFRIEV